jgi:hypothetical protein
MRNIGIGSAYWEKDKPLYKGTFPINRMEEEALVYMIRKEDFDMLIESNLERLMQVRVPMEKHFYEKDEIPDILQIKTARQDGSMKETTLYLDRHFYSLNSEKMIWTRWASMDEYVDEGEL